MNTLEIVLLMLIQGFLCICCFNIGARTGQKVVKGEDLEPAIKNPIETYKEVKESIELKRLQDRDEIIANNIDVYDGTSEGQIDVPNV